MIMNMQTSLPNFYPCTYTSMGVLQNCSDLQQLYKLRVEGKGNIKVQPDTAEVVLGVSTENRQLQAAQQENAAKITAIISSLQRLGVAETDIRTQTYAIEPQYDYVEGQQVFRGYRVLHTLQVTVRDINEVGEIIDAAVESGANIVSSISFTTSRLSGYYEQALNAAVDDAVSKAVSLGNKLGINVFPTPIRIIEQSCQVGPIPEPALLQAQQGATPIQAGQIEITACIETIFSYTMI